MAAMKLIVHVFGIIVLAGTVLASDPELTSDFFIPPDMNISMITGDYFTFTGLRNFSAPPGALALKKLTLLELPALTGLGVGITLIEFQPGTLNPPHTHPRGTEVLFVLEGSLHVGLVDTTGKLYTQILQEEDVFVFPKGLAHFQLNMDPEKKARALASFSSSNAGLLVLPKTLFGSGICSEVLEKAFMINGETLTSLEEPYGPVPKDVHC